MICSEESGAMASAKKALITGISGQDGSYLAEFLLARGYEVHGLVLQSDLDDPERCLSRISPLLSRLTLHPVPLESYTGLRELIEKIQPEECYHLAAVSFVGYTSENELATFRTNIDGTHAVLLAIREGAPACRYFFAASSEMFGHADRSPQDESTPFRPRSIYGVTKVTGFHLTRLAREQHGLFGCSGILYNHESERRGREFVTRKITSTVARIKLGQATELHLGNLDAMRDWGYAPDYVEAMWLMLQQEQPDDYVIASGEPHSVRDFARAAFDEVGLDWEKYVMVDPRFYRPAERIILTGDASKARRQLGWSPRVRFAELLRRMVAEDLRQAERA
jgi:GDPmannose 4,6-dehydratase